MIRTAQRWHWTLVVVVVFAIVTAACSGGDDAFNTTAAATDVGEVTLDAAGAASEPSRELATPKPDDGLGSGGVTPIALQVVDLGRDIIYTADLVVAVTDVGAAGAEATQIVASVGGYLFGQQTTGAPEPRSVLIFKVQPEDFQDTLTLLGGIGEVRTQTVTADDVTERVVDLESRIKTAEASVERLQGFLAEATDIKTIAGLEAQLLQRETDLETLRGQLRTIQDRVDLATITLTLTEALANPAIHLEVTAYPGHDDAGASCPGEDGFAVDKGEPVTLCFQVTNIGDTPLTQFELTDSILGVEMADLIVVFGDPTEALQPGQSFTLAAEITADQDVRTRTRVAAVPINQEGEPIAGRTVASTDQTRIRAVDPGGLPGFQDGLNAAWNLLLWMGGVVVLFAGVLLPFLWVPVVIWLIWTWRRKRKASTTSAAPEAPDTEPDPVEPAEAAAAE